MVLALARPQRVGEPVERVKAARDVVLALDISGSMDTRDFEDASRPTPATPRGRQRGRGGIRRGREGDRMGLIVFGSKAYVQAPLTEDLDTILALLDRTDVGMAGPHTALGDAIGLAIRTFEASEIDQRLLILLSDGSDTASAMSPVNAAEIAASEGVEIHTIGVGDPEASGEDQVDLAALQDIARRTGGAYFYASDAEALEQVYERIDALAPRETETFSYRPRRSLAHWPLGIALLIGLGATAALHLRPAADPRNPPRERPARDDPSGRHRRLPLPAAGLAAGPGAARAAVVERADRSDGSRGAAGGDRAPSARRPHDGRRNRHADPAHRRGGARPRAAGDRGCGADMVASARPVRGAIRPPRDRAQGHAVDGGRDIAPTRLERSKQKIRDLLDLRAGARTALVAYAGSAHVAVPMTEDPGVMLPYLEGLSPEVMPTEGNRAAQALALASDLLAREQGPGAVLFVTDGIDPADAAALTQATAEVMVLAMLPEGQADRGIDALADVPVIAVTADRSDVARIDRMLDAAQARAALAESDQPWLDRGPWLAWPAALLILLWFRRGWTMRWAALTALALMLPAPGARADGLADWFLTPDQQGRLAFERNDFARAAEVFSDPLWRGYALYRDGQYDEAVEVLDRVETAQAAFIQGMAHIKSRGYRDGVRAFQTALARDPDYPAAAENLSVAMEIVEYIERTREQSDTGEEAGMGADEIVFDNEANRGAETRIEASQEGDAGMLTAAQWMTTVDTRTGDFLRAASRWRRRGADRSGGAGRRNGGRRMIRLLAVLLLLALPAVAQEPVLRMEMDASEAVPGQAVSLRLTVLVPTFMPDPPVWPSYEAPDLLVRIASTGPVSERIDGETWSGVSRRYLVAPMLPGAVDLPQRRSPSPGTIPRRTRRFGPVSRPTR